MVKRQLARKVFPVHRLDHRTSGAMLFAFDSETAGELHETAIRKGRKKYVALVRGEWTKSNEDNESFFIVDKPLEVKGITKNAVTKFTLLGTTPGETTNERCSLLLCEPLTGRTHQIRRHLFSIGHPVIGDSQHGDNVFNRWWRKHRSLNRLALHCWTIDFELQGTSYECLAPLSPNLKAVLERLPLWEESLHNEPRLALDPVDKIDGTHGRSYKRRLIRAGAYEASSPPSKTQFHVAPMQCYTNGQTRKLFDLLSPSSIKWTEMEKLDDIYPRTESVEYLSEALEKRLGPPQNPIDTANLVLQLGTNDPDRLQTCVEHTTKLYDNLREINLNCGCPAIESGGASTYGASLMKDAPLTGQLVATARKGLKGSLGSNDGSPQISVKCRIGVFETDKDMRPLTESDHESLREYISTIHEHGANHVILHARPAILSGLSPAKNRIVPPLDYGFVETIASEFRGKVDVTLNGGITTLEQLRSFQEDSKSGGTSAISSYMAGRWCLRRPLDLIGIEALLLGEESPNSSSSLIQAAIEHYVDDVIRMESSSSSLLSKHKPTVSDLCLPLFLITEQLRDDYDYDEDENSITTTEPPLLTYDEMELVYDVMQDGVAQIEDLFGKGKKKNKPSNGSVNFKRLSSSFKSLVGTKVANKWKRNRAEL
eukprot:jgi/Psemu1/63548/estExt_Genemark1.C_290122